MNKLQREENARLHLKQMQIYENELHEKGIKLIAGVDEVGRGPLAGPVVAAAVILPADFDILYVDDSKKISEKRRETLYDEIISVALDYKICEVDNEVIDRINILEATKVAMKNAICGLKEIPEYLLIDALTLKDIDIPQMGIIKGDSKSVSIAAASIIAKVYRDRLMCEMHKIYPDYAFDRNKGYGTPAHYAGIREAGITQIHRKSFLKGIL